MWPGGGTLHCSRSRQQLQLAGLEPVEPVPGQSAGQLCSRKERHSLERYLHERIGEEEREREREK